VSDLSPVLEGQRGLRDLTVGESFTGYYVIRRRELRTKKDGGFYLVLEFGDRTGRITGNLWDDAERLYADFEEGGVVKLRGVVEQYRDSKVVAVRQIRRAAASDPVATDALIPTIEGDPDQLFARLYGIIEGVRNEHLLRLLRAFFDDESFVGAFKRAPGGKLWHHNRLGGLLEHTLSLVRLMRLLSRRYPDVDRDLLITGALLHDIGKIEEYRYDTLIDYTDRGRLVGHIPLGGQWVSERAARLEGFPPALLDQVLHLVLSHQAEFGSPVQPMTREAFLLHYADQIDSKMDALKRITDEPGGGRWRFVKLLDRFIDIGRENDNHDSLA
jgi:3'-5' exoribonuclease